MKTRQISWIILLLAAFPTVLLAQSKERDQQRVALSSPGKPFKLNMNLAGGSLNINTYEGIELRITATIAQNTNEKSGQVNNQNVNINTNVNVNVNNGASGNNTNRNKLLKVSQNNNEVIITQLNQNRALDVEVNLPKIGTSLNLSLSGKNNVNVEGISGEIEVTSADGPVNLKNISGSAIATTVNGNISASFTNVNPKAPMAFSTLIGNVDLSFPVAVKASVTLKSDQGVVSSEFILTGIKNTKLMNNGNGYYQAKLSGGVNMVKGNVNGGGQAISISNMQGSIYLRKHK